MIKESISISIIYVKTFHAEEEQTLGSPDEYDSLMTFPEMDHELAREIYELIVETVVCLGKEIVISSNRFPIEVVRSRFLKLNYMHIRYVMECLEKNTTKVKNIRKYLLAALFNAPATMDGYYMAEVKHDMYGIG